jgi:hypothetical protein
MARRRRHKKSGCSHAGLKKNGRLKKGYRFAKGRKGCTVPAR